MKRIHFLRPFNFEPFSWHFVNFSELNHFLQVSMPLRIVMGHEGSYTPSLDSSFKYLRLGRMNQSPLYRHLKAEIILKLLAVSTSYIHTPLILEEQSRSIMHLLMAKHCPNFPYTTALSLMTLSIHFLSA